MLSRIEISKKNLRDNFAAMKSLVRPGTEIVSVIKANAYGHGQNEVASVLEDVTDRFQADDLSELRLLRKITKKPVLVLGYVASDEIVEALRLEGTLSVYDTDHIMEVNEAARGLAKTVNVHVKIDAGLGRQGVLPENVGEVLGALKRCGHIRVEALYSHFANIEDTSDFSHAKKQIDAFQNAVSSFRANGHDTVKTHMSASSGIMMYETNGGVSDMVRPGIGLYGMWPSDDLKARFSRDDFDLKPALRWVTHVAQVKMLPAGHSIGYGLTYITAKPTKVAVIPQGYSDGYDRGLSNAGEVLIGGTRCPVLGRVAMNMFVANVSHLSSVRREDEVVLLGEQGSERITAEEIAERLGTINYEVTTRISPLLPRIIV
ncbi:MAG: alanine racemase [Candidatus Moranbacteria bacterium]|nr:alanine racemase [Candidatus Moranbacteria bacterium]